MRINPADCPAPVRQFLTTVFALGLWISNRDQWIDGKGRIRCGKCYTIRTEDAVHEFWHKPGKGWILSRTR